MARAKNATVAAMKMKSIIVVLLRVELPHVERLPLEFHQQCKIDPALIFPQVRRETRDQN